MLVDPNSIHTTICHYFKLDLNTCTAEDVSYSQRYSLTMLRDTRIDFLVVWFDSGFAQNLTQK